MTNRTVVFAPHFAPGFRAGGTLRSLVSIVDTAPPDTEVLVVTSDRDLNSAQPYTTVRPYPVRRGRHWVLYINPANPRHILRWIRYVRQYRPTGIYINSLWNVGLAIIPALLVALRIVPSERLAIAPRGQLSGSAVRISALRKRTAAVLWRTVARIAPVAWHATDHTEESQIQAYFGTRRPTVVSMDPVDLPRSSAKSRPIPEDHLRILFVGRVAPIKNLHTLISGIVASRTNAHLTILGPIEDQEYHSAILESGRTLDDRLEIRGSVSHETILEEFGKHDVMFFPSLSENFGHVIAESLSMECPVVCGAISPFTTVIESGGGDIIDNTSIEEWAKVTRRWAEMSPDELAHRRLVSGKAYSEWRQNRDETHILSLLLAH